MKHWSKRLFYGLIFAIPMMLLTYAWGQAARSNDQIVDGPLYCPECHQAFQQAWEKGDHGQATTDPAFKQAWTAQGQPGECLVCHTTGYDETTGTWAHDGITCEACHSPVTSNHPLAPMSIDTSAELCGKCHSETHFEWQISKHREAEVDCAACHDPHATALKNNDPGLLCASCHRQRASNFAHSAHSSEGLTCKDCHLQPLDQDPGSGHARQDHSFFVSLNTCNACHEYQMHDPVEVHPEPKAEVTVDAMSSVESNEVTEEPLPVSPVGYTTLSGLVGIAAGVILAPWIERLNRRRKDEKES